MPRVARRSVGGLIYHVLNRSNSRKRLFATDADYRAFIAVLIEALQRFPRVKPLAFCVMPNHWHLVLEPERDGDLSAFMRWLTQTHTQRWRRFKRTVGYGALYQGRYKSFVVQDDHHFLVLCRYVERNARRAGLVRRAESWRWCSAWSRAKRGDAIGSLLAEWPIARPSAWIDLLNEPQRDSDEETVRRSIARGRPLGEDGWVERMARKLGQLHALRSPGRPKGSKDQHPRKRRAVTPQDRPIANTGTIANTANTGTESVFKRAIPFSASIRVSGRAAGDTAWQANR